MKGWRQVVPKGIRLGWDILNIMEIRKERLLINSGMLGGENPLPYFKPIAMVNRLTFDENVPSDERKFAGYGCATAVLPYKLQDKYDRNMRPREFEIIVLENNLLKAVFHPSLGGRLWSFYDKVSQRELLDVNPVIHFVNLTYRNAWFAGGVEWNCSVQGYTPLTCSPLFAGIVECNGIKALRLYKFERVRQIKGQTILPTNKCAKFKNSVKQKGHAYIFSYKGKDSRLKYSVVPQPKSLGDIAIEVNGRVIRPCEGSQIQLIDPNSQWQQVSKKLDGGKLIVKWQVRVNNVTKFITTTYHIDQKSLIIDMAETEDTPGIVKSIELGYASDAQEYNLIRVPFLNYNYKEAPRVLDAKGIFVFSQFDWYHSQASRLQADTIGKEDDRTVFNSRALYTPKLDGNRNPLSERLYITASPDFQEMLPNIPNPPSPMEHIMGNRVWLVMNCEDYNCRLSIPARFRACGIEHAAVRYHEPVWRDLGESYTFKTTAAPKQGGDEALKKISADIRSLGWLFGLYSNYTDFITLNPHWNEDWLLLNQYGDWLPSWFRCYSPKPMIGVEQQKNFSPVIHEKFDTNHCYSDVHTAIPMFDRVDYDPRVPGAGTFRRTYECYGRILLGEREAHKGPIFSEGDNCPDRTFERTDTLTMDLNGMR